MREEKSRMRTVAGTAGLSRRERSERSRAERNEANPVTARAAPPNHFRSAKMLEEKSRMRTQFEPERAQRTESGIRRIRLAFPKMEICLCFALLSSVVIGWAREALAATLVSKLSPRTGQELNNVEFNASPSTAETPAKSSTTHDELYR